MPKIFINELDKTSAGTPNDYSNYAVLVTGFQKAIPEAGENGLTAEELKELRESYADGNGVYEFSSEADFKKVVGCVAPKVSLQVGNAGAGDTLDIYHYGNQIAYKLLELGCHVIYMPIEQTLAGLKKLTDGEFWKVFEDKANYDFRFITHGLLKSADENINSEDRVELKAITDRLTLVNDAIEALDRIGKQASENATNPPPNQDFEETVWQNILYSGSSLEEDWDGDAIEGIRDEYPGFIAVGSSNAYNNYSEAVSETKAEVEKLTATKKDLEETVNASQFTKADFNSVNKCIADLAANGRGDCIALVEIDESSYLNATSEDKPEKLISAAITDMSDAIADKGAYCAVTVPSVVYKMTADAAYGDNKRFPGAFHYLTCFINSLKLGFNEWYAAAGYTRGVSNYTIDYTTVKLGEVAINALEPRNISKETDPAFACNVIANFRGSYYLWGNRTAAKLGDVNSVTDGDLKAKHFLNIRQLCTTIKKQLYVACRRFTFDPNSDTLWFNFVNAIKPTLEAMKADQGIRDYKVLKVVENNPKKATLKAKIRIIPIEAVEDFEIEVSLEDSFGETNAVTSDIQ